MTGEQRRARYLYGLESERLAAIYLRAKGYRILAQRFRAAGGEIDIVAARWQTLAFVEVKARPSMDEARLSITQDKKRRMSRAARAFLGHLPRLPRQIRLDALYLAPWHWPRHETAIAELDLN